MCRRAYCPTTCADPTEIRGQPAALFPKSESI
ncbi:hypothetical protein RHECNPAF_1330025 [Rhizobium etli CNPAF512]|nr:hypothetical protein RHECNPAF_1330025 [Rhizobium etli CNPAF512]